MWGPYVYVGSINLDYYSIHENREIGLLIYNPQLANNLKALILQWYEEASQTTKPIPTIITNLEKAALIAVIITLILIIIWTKKHQHNITKRPT